MMTSSVHWLYSDINLQSVSTSNLCHLHIFKLYIPFIGHSVFCFPSECYLDCSTYKSVTGRKYSCRGAHWCDLWSDLISSLLSVLLTGIFSISLLYTEYFTRRIMYWFLLSAYQCLKHSIIELIANDKDY